MAVEKKRIKSPEYQESTPRKTRRDRQPTLCPDERRRYNHCGVCGYGDIAFEGVDYCEGCGKEELVISETRWGTAQGKWMKCCTHSETYRGWHGKVVIQEYSSVKRYGVYVCLACGAVKRPRCPACGHDVWTKGFKQYCQRCNYRADISEMK